MGVQKLTAHMCQSLRAINHDHSSKKRESNVEGVWLLGEEEAPLENTVEFWECSLLLTHVSTFKQNM